MAYDIFISYRRKGAGAGVAGELQAKLENLGYKVFLDVDEIGSGQFPMQIEKAIGECKDFLLVLSPGTLDRCVDKEDWVRREILHAQDQGKNIVGVGLPGFMMPDANALPPSMEWINTIQVFSWTHEYRTASFTKIEENLLSSKLRKKRILRKRLAIVAAAVVAIAALVLLMPKKAPVVKSEPVATTTVEDDNFVIDKQKFEHHAERALELSQNLIDGAQFKTNLIRGDLDPNMESVDSLMIGIAECDSAIALKYQYRYKMQDPYDIEGKRENLISLRKGYLSIILDDVKSLLEEGGAAKFVKDDMKFAEILALPEEKHTIDSLKQLLKTKINPIKP